MTTREARCHCGQLRLEVDGEPFAISICHCHACKRRTGSAFGMQAGFAADQVRVVGRHATYVRISDEADRRPHAFHFCPECGGQIFSTEPDDPELLVVSAGAFADDAFPAPTVSGYDSRRHAWIGLPDDVARHAPELWEPVQPLYDAKRFAEAADRGRAIADAHPAYPALAYNVACCESRAGRGAAALASLAQAIAGWDGFRDLARGDADLDAIRDEPGFARLVGDEPDAGH